MFHTFTGNSRRPRNVNLSGQNRNPFASAAQTSQPASLGGTNAVTLAQQERRARQIERERQQAARDLQRCWRGRQDRLRVRAACRRLWDEEQEQLQSQPSASSSQQQDPKPVLKRAKMLAWFAEPANEGDLARVTTFERWLMGKMHATKLDGALVNDCRIPLVKLAKFGLSWFAMQHSRTVDDRSKALLELVAVVAHEYPAEMAKIGTQFYGALGFFFGGLRARDAVVQTMLVHAILSPLTQETADQEQAYEGFVTGILMVPEIHLDLDLDKLAPVAYHGRLARFLRGLVTREPQPEVTSRLNSKVPPTKRLQWLTAYFIHLHKAAESTNVSGSSEIDFVFVLSSFLSRFGGRRHGNTSFDSAMAKPSASDYVNDRVMSLFSQESVSKLFTYSNFASSIQQRGLASEDAAILASYALTLLQVFPRKADEVRQWLYLSSTSASQSGAESEPAVKYFWKAVVSTSVYKGILKSYRNAIPLIKQGRGSQPDADLRSSVNQEWRVILLFVELYSFVLRIMDDDEFMAGGSSSTTDQSRLRQSALDLEQVQELTIFLKNFAFAMYWEANSIMDLEKTQTPDTLSIYFGKSEIPARAPAAYDDYEMPAFAGVGGMTMSNMKGLATGLLRALYERDSRRSFCEPDHWLMKDIELQGFNDAVIVEQTLREKEEEREEELADDDEEDGDDGGALHSEDEEDYGLVGTGRAQQIRRLERLRKEQRKAMRNKMVQNLTPRLEILQNMPFLIPFTTRVEIVHQSVLQDQIQRRNGFVDPDQWRMSIEGPNMLFGGPRSRRRGHEEISRHTAEVRRDHIFDDAFSQFYKLGDGLKEPIQITFMDQFGTTEVGIDGGGVTKEFLISITSEAFSPAKGNGLFIENDQHLLYPNPSITDELKEQMREIGVLEGSREWNSQLRDLLQRYEFLGRVVGKCLYEGILIDVHFAPFFLVKWALTGGKGAASRETSYRPTLNDLRDLDEALYQGLLKLKNYPGNVEDFGLDFSVTDIVARQSPSQPEKVATRDLRQGWGDTPVTNVNRLVYISDMARHRLQTQPVAQTNAFLRGLGAMIPPGWLSMFNRRELQTLLSGTAAEIDVADLRSNTLYGGVYAIGDDGLEHPTVQLFWRVLAEFDDQERRKLLKYVTSTPRAPLLGFVQLNPRFSIRDSGSDQSRLPSTSTCVNLLKLPIYRDKEQLREKLSYAINAGAGFNLS